GHRVRGRAEDPRRIAGAGGLEEARERALERVLRRTRGDRLAARGAAQAEVGIEPERERRLLGDDVERVDPGRALARPRNRDRADGAGGEVEDERRGVLDVAALALALRDEDAARRGLD